MGAPPTHWHRFRIIAHIARVEPLTVRRTRQVIAKMLASRLIDPVAGSVQLQIARLSEAMIVAHTMMMEGNLQAMDRWLELTSELSRHHSFAPAQIPAALDAAAAPRPGAPAPCSVPPDPAPSEVEGKFSASQALEIPRNAEAISESTASSRIAAPERRPIPPNPALGEVEGKFFASQACEIPQKRERILGAAAAGPRHAPSSARSPPNSARGEHRGISVAGMAPQRFEKIESTPGDGMGSKASSLQDVVHGRRLIIRSSAASNPDWSHKKVGQLRRGAIRRATASSA